MILSSSLNPNRMAQCLEVLKIATCYQQQAKVYRNFTEKEILLMTIEMMMGAQNSCFGLNNKKFFQKKLPSFRCSHICQQTLNVCIESCMALGNKHQYIRSQSIRLHAQMKKINSGVLQAIVEGVMSVSNDFNVFLTQCLQEIYQHCGQVRIISQDDAPTQTFTLITLLNRVSLHERCAYLLVLILSNLSAKMPLQSRDDCARCVKSMLDLYLHKTQEFQCDQQAIYYIQLIFLPALKLYLQIAVTWIRNDNFSFKSLHNSGFFIDFASFQIALNTTRLQLLNYQQNIKDQNNSNHNYENTSEYKAILLSSNFCFKQTIPNIFCEFAEMILSLGKALAFTFLYFDADEKYKLLQYFSIDQLFQPLFSTLTHKQFHKSLKFYTNIQLKHKNFDISTRFRFQKGIGMKTKIKPQFINNPYKMSIQTKGTFSFSSKIFQISNQLPIKQIQSQHKDKKQDRIKFNNSLHKILTNLKQKSQNLLKGSPKEAFLSLQIKNFQRIRLTIEETIIGIRRFMLCEQGDFMQQFLVLMFDILDKPSQKIARHSIQNCIQQALRNSGANALSKSVTRKLSFISLRVKMRETDKMKGWSIFSLSFKPEKPMDCLFTPSFMYSLSEIYNFILNFRRCLYKITTMWAEKQQIQNHRQQYPFYGLRNAMHHYISVVLQYLTQSFSEAVQKYQNEINSCCQFTQIMQANDKLVDQLGKITVNQSILCSCLITLIQLIEKFTSEECDFELITVIYEELNSVIQTTRKIKKLEEMFFDHQYD